MNSHELNRDYFLSLGKPRQIKFYHRIEAGPPSIATNSLTSLGHLAHVLDFHGIHAVSLSSSARGLLSTLQTAGNSEAGLKVVS